MKNNIQHFNSLDEALSRNVTLEMLRNGSKENGDYWMPAVISGEYYLINYDLVQGKLSVRNSYHLVCSDQ